MSGQDVTKLWNVRQLCSYLGISKDTFNRKVKKGVYPEEAYRDERGRRYWTQEQAGKMLRSRLRVK